jgi:hypothetical protein
MRYKTVLAVSALFAVMLAVAVLGPSSDMSDAVSERWITEENNGMAVEYNGGTTLTVRLDADPGPGLYTVDVTGSGGTKALSAGGKDAIVNLGESLDSSATYLVIAHASGWDASCKLRLATLYSVSTEVSPAGAGEVNGAGDYVSGTTLTLTASAAEGYLFDGWFSGSERVSAQAEYTFSATADKALTAKFINATSTITFDSNGGSAVDGITQAYGTVVTAPADPVREGYTFVGWEPAFPSIMPAGNTTYVAQWTVNTYTITFDTLGGSEVAAITQDYGTAVTAPADPAKEGFTFVKWDQEIPSTVPAKDLTISAVWAAMNATVDESGKTEVVLDKDTDAFVIPADTKTVTVTVDENISVVIQDTSSIGAGTTVITKVEEIPNTAEVDGTARAYEVTVTKADDQPITGKMQVTLPYTPEKGKVPAVYWQNGSALEKMRVISHTSDSVTFETTHNSTYVVVAESVSEDSGATFMLYLGLLMVVGIALSMLVGFNYYRRKA